MLHKQNIVHFFNDLISLVDSCSCFLIEKVNNYKTRIN